MLSRTAGFCQERSFTFVRKLFAYDVFTYTVFSVSRKYEQLCLDWPCLYMTGHSSTAWKKLSLYCADHRSLHQIFNKSEQMKTWIYSKPLRVFVMALLPLTSLAAEPVWHEFDFAVGAAIGPEDERLALLLRAWINGRQCWMQLDTGAPLAVIWHNALPVNASNETLSNKIIVKIGDIEKTIAADAATLDRLREGACPIGSVGNGFFEHGTLSMDFRSSRFAFTPGATLDTDIAAEPMHFLKNAQGGGYPLLHAVMFNGVLGELLFDTGSARFGVAANSLEQWQALTGVLPLDAPVVRSYPINNVMDAAPLRCFETNVSDSITLAGQQLKPGIVSYCQKNFSLPVPLAGILGLRALVEHRVTLDYISGRWKLEHAPFTPIRRRSLPVD